MVIAGPVGHWVPVIGVCTCSLYLQETILKQAASKLFLEMGISPASGNLQEQLFAAFSVACQKRWDEICNEGSEAEKFELLKTEARKLAIEAGCCPIALLAEQKLHFQRTVEPAIKVLVPVCLTISKNENFHFFKETCVGDDGDEGWLDVQDFQDEQDPSNGEFPRWIINIGGKKVQFGDVLNNLLTKKKNEKVTRYCNSKS